MSRDRQENDNVFLKIGIYLWSRISVVSMVGVHFEFPGPRFRGNCEGFGESPGLIFLDLFALEMLYPRCRMADKSLLMDATNSYGPCSMSCVCFYNRWKWPFLDVWMVGAFALLPHFHVCALKSLGKSSKTLHICPKSRSLKTDGVIL